MKPWITKVIKLTIRKRNRLFKWNNSEKYKLYRYMIPTSTRVNKKSYYHSFSARLSQTRERRGKALVSSLGVKGEIVNQLIQ